MSHKKNGHLGKIASRSTKETEELILARYEREFLLELMNIWPDREKNVVGLTQLRLATLTGISLRSIASYCNKKDPVQPDRNSLNKLGKFFGIHWVEDYDNSINMTDLLERIKAFIPPVKAS